ncbi:PAS domain-containing sensor histidine kinase [Hymenobacter defluvii]|uniref:histidine kinase n=1 Tax=Hymenobacter defluvii TaxID=2054411 RepID=A0ABS3TLC1_9BACT|nr:HAMP domain-containing sensor histidine kinase [Hymenobacter defluvii]MBO3273404.1 HAMP domain-containing histidine kinase [Hymenobacter defluvii]
MVDLAAFLVAQAEASTHVQFVYNVTNGQVEYVCRAYDHVFGGQASEATAELPGLLARIHPDDHEYLANYWRLWVTNRITEDVEVRLVGPDQAIQWFCLTPFWQQQADGTVLVGGMLRDISVGKRHAENADRFNVRKNATLEILSHDTSGAFAMVQQIVDYLREELPTVPGSRAHELLHVLARTSEQSVRMIRDFINVEFLASTNTDLKRDRVDIGEVLGAPLDDFRRNKALLGQHFTCSLPATPVYVELDVNKFTQVITNLISNALKFTPDGGRVMVRIESLPTSVRIEVEDEGIGIPLALQAHLFEPFTKARRPGLRGEPTTGLGLTLCKTVVEWHQGTLTVVSTEGQGSTFTIELPRAGLFASVH